MSGKLITVGLKSSKTIKIRRITTQILEGRFLKNNHYWEDKLEETTMKILKQENILKQSLLRRKIGRKTMDKFKGIYYKKKTNNTDI